MNHFWKTTALAVLLFDFAAVVVNSLAASLAREAGREPVFAHHVIVAFACGLNGIPLLGLLWALYDRQENHHPRSAPGGSKADPDNTCDHCGETFEFSLRDVPCPDCQRQNAP